jgi:type IX secretion system PorP/SprF family membrane protein
MTLRKIPILLFAFFAHFIYAQEGIAVYSDYLSDNLYLLHPSMAGASSCGKIRLTGRQQWFDQKNSPALQTLSFHTRVGERSGIGAIAFNDRNGYHSQRGAKLTYAHHIMFSRSSYDLNQLSFGLSAGMVQSQIDQSSFDGFDPIINNGVIVKDAYFNIDAGASYNFLDFSAHFTIKNLIANKRELYTDIESDNLRKYILSAAYVFGDEERFLWEPSFMFQYVDQTKEKFLDLNLKVYREMDFGRLWGGLSYRQAFEGAQFVSGSTLNEQRLQWFSPVIGVNYKQFMFAYTYTHLTGDIRFDNAGFHQLTLGIDIFCQPSKWSCNCPAVN